MRRVLPSLAVTLALVMAPLQFAVLALGGIQVTLTCSDGTDIMDTTLVVDAAALTELQSVVEAMTLYPAGLVCRITQQLTGSFGGGFFAPLVAFAQGGNPTWNYAVGGGRAQLVDCFPPAETNFALSARVDPTAAVTEGQGMFNMTVPQCTVNETPFNGSHLGTKVKCLTVTVNTFTGVGRANLIAEVTHATGLFAANGPAVGATIDLQVIDSGVPGGAFDMIGMTAGGESECGGARADKAVDNGNISVHEAP